MPDIYRDTYKIVSKTVTEQKGFVVPKEFNGAHENSSDRYREKKKTFFPKKVAAATGQ